MTTLRPYFAWALLTYAAAELFFIFLNWLLISGGTNIFQRSYRTDTTTLTTVGLPMLAVLITTQHGLAWAQFMFGDLNAAEANFNRAMELDRNFAETHGGLASIAALRGEKANAEHLIEIATRLDSECLSAKFAEAVLLGRAGNAAQAQKALVDTVTALSAKNGSALSRLLTKVIRR